MKISEMNREQLKEYLHSSGEIHRQSKDSKAWQRAFELARSAGNGELDMGCGKCWDKVKEWIKR